MKIKDYENYEVLENGTVIGARGKPLKTDKNSTGYHRITLCKGGIPKRVFVHRLIAEHFVDRPGEGLVVNHIDGNNQNNHKDNLEWVTPSENVKDGWRRGRDTSMLHLNFKSGKV